MKNISIILSILAIILGIVAGYFVTLLPFSGSAEIIMTGAIIVTAIAVIIAIFMYPAFGASIQATFVSLIVCAGAGMFALGIFLNIGETSNGAMFAFIGIAAAGLSFFLCPCFCMQSSKTSRSSVIGIAAAHDSISIDEISQKTGLSTTVVSSILYDAIGKRQLTGRMDGSTFKRSGPTPSAGPPDAKVFVICPYCGAKTEQGLSKCQKCGADL
jgi:hypothetical protein